MTWRYIPFSHNRAAMNMAIDEAVSEGVACSLSPPTVRLYGWRPSAVSIGCFQNLDDEVDIEACREVGVEIVRRRTGGGAVYHDEQGEVTYSVIALESEVPADINEAYQEICGVVMRALLSLGIDSEFRPINDIIVFGRKISGSAQTRRGGVFLQHGTIIYDLDASMMFKLLKAPKLRAMGKHLLDPRNLITSVKSTTDASIQDLISELRSSFATWTELRDGELNPFEKLKAVEVAKERYSNDLWTKSR